MRRRRRVGLVGRRAEVGARRVDRGGAGVVEHALVGERGRRAADRVDAAAPGLLGRAVVRLDRRHAAVVAEIVLAAAALVNVRLFVALEAHGRERLAVPVRPHREHAEAAAVRPLRPAVEVVAAGPVAEPVAAGLLRDERGRDEVAGAVLDPRDDLRVVAVRLRHVVDLDDVARRAGIARGGRCRQAGERRSDGQGAARRHFQHYCRSGHSAKRVRTGECDGSRVRSCRYGVRRGADAQHRISRPRHRDGPRHGSVESGPDRKSCGPQVDRRRARSVPADVGTSNHRDRLSVAGPRLPAQAARRDRRPRRGQRRTTASACCSRTSRGSSAARGRCS